MADSVLLKVENHIATVTFNRPEVRNAINYGTWLQLGVIVGKIESDPAVRCVVFRGSGEAAFSAGADIKDFRDHRFDSKSARTYAEAFEGVQDRVERLPQPTISMIHGYCVGGGLEFATCTDIRIAAEGSTFGVPVSRLGIVAGYKETRRLLRVAGPAATSYLLNSGRLISAQEALRIGLVSGVVPSDALETEVYRLAGEIAHNSPLTHRNQKLIIRKALNNPALANLSATDLSLQYDVFNSADFLEGVKAFIEKRRPEFTGN